MNSSETREVAITLMVAVTLAGLLGCHAPSSGPLSPDDQGLEGDGDGEAAEVIVASIDPDLPTPGADLRIARIALAQAEEAEEVLAGSIAVALTGDPAALEILIRGLGDPETCVDATTALAFLPKRLATRPLWLALRLDCSTTMAQAAARVLGLEAMITAAEQADELPRPRIVQTGPNRPDERDPCEVVIEALEPYSPAAPLSDSAPLPERLSQLAEARWALPTNAEELCTEPALAAAVRLRNGDSAVRLAFDLSLDTPGSLPEYMLNFITRFGLGGASERLAQRLGEADGELCVTLLEAGRLETTLPVLRAEPETVSLCLLQVVELLSGHQDEDEVPPILSAIASAAPHPGCGAGALAAVLAQVANGQQPPRWTADATVLGKALAETLDETRGEEAEQLEELHDVVERLRPRPDPPPEDGPVRLLQRDIRTVLEAATGPRRSALLLLLEAGSR